MNPHGCERVQERAGAIRTRIRSFTDLDPALRREAQRRLTLRLRGFAGHEPVHLEPALTWKHGDVRTGVLHIDEDPVEHAIVRALANTWGDHQFGVSPSGSVFASRARGLTPHEERLYVTGLSPALDRAARVLLTVSGGHGGRLYEREGVFFVPSALAHRA